MDIDLELMGPIDYLVVEFPGSRMSGEGLPRLIELVDRGIIRILDLVFIRKLADGSIERMDVSGYPELAAFDGVASRILDEDDFDAAGSVIGPGSTAGLILYENHWAAPLATALRRGGAQLVAGGRIPVQALLAALDATEPAQGRVDSKR